MKKNLVITTLFLIVVPRFVFAQCSCGGTPLLGSLDLPATAPGNWQFALTYDFNNIAEFYSGTDKRSSTLKRRTHSGLLEVSYGLTIEDIRIISVISCPAEQSRCKYGKDAGVG